jgi:hypothetical protein
MPKTHALEWGPQPLLPIRFSPLAWRFEMNALHQSIRPAPGLCLLSVALFQAGCGENLPSNSDPAQARALVTQALDSWKSGREPASLVSSSPPLRVNDREWGDGYLLERYELKGESQRLGLNIQQAVALQLRSKKGKAVKKTVNYIVSTGSQPMLWREDIDE